MGHPPLAGLGRWLGRSRCPGVAPVLHPHPKNLPCPRAPHPAGPPACCEGSGDSGAAGRGGLEHLRSLVVTASWQGTLAVRTQPRDVLPQGTLALPTPLAPSGPARGVPGGRDRGSLPCHRLGLPRTSPRPSWGAFGTLPVFPGWRRGRGRAAPGVPCASPGRSRVTRGGQEATGAATGGTRGTGTERLRRRSPGWERLPCRAG